MVQLAIKSNSLEALFSCALCGEDEHANAGPQLFMADTWAPVCRDCGEIHSRELSSLLDLAVAARAYTPLRR